MDLRANCSEGQVVIRLRNVERRLVHLSHDCKTRPRRIFQTEL